MNKQKKLNFYKVALRRSVSHELIEGQDLM